MLPETIAPEAGRAAPDSPWSDELLDYKQFFATRLEREPFDYLVVPGFVPPPIALAAAEAFPGPDLPGVLPAPAVPPNNAFGRLLTSLRSETLTRAFAWKFGRTLSTDRLMVTLRARTRRIDGRIHNDSATKVITALVYLNGDWSDSGGRLRLLRGRLHRRHDRRGAAACGNADCLRPVGELVARPQAIRRGSARDHAELDDGRRHGAPRMAPACVVRRVQAPVRRQVRGDDGDGYAGDNA